MWVHHISQRPTITSFVVEDSGKEREIIRLELLLKILERLAQLGIYKLIEKMYMLIGTLIC
jgi:hypothetical protein